MDRPRPWRRRRRRGGSMRSFLAEGGGHVPAGYERSGELSLRACTIPGWQIRPIQALLVQDSRSSRRTQVHVPHGLLPADLELVDKLNPGWIIGADAAVEFLSCTADSRSEHGLVAEERCGVRAP